MTQINFTLNYEELIEAVMKSDIENYMKSVVTIVLNSVMEKEREDYLKAASYERITERVDYRNGYYDRELLLKIGRITLRVPRTRNGQFSPSIFEKYERKDQAFIMAMLEMFVNGVSTRKVTNIVETLCGESVSKSFVSSLTEKLDPIVKEWANRSLGTLEIIYVLVDAMYIKVRENNRVVSKAAYIATGIDKYGKRHVLGLHIDHAESKESWTRFLESLKGRGLSSPKLVISDAHKGLVKAIQECFVGTSWQRCHVHFMRNVLAPMPKKESRGFSHLLSQVYQAHTEEEARGLKEELVAQFETDARFKKSLEILDDGFEDTIQYYQIPNQRHHRSIRSTNSLERINQEVRRRETVIRIFPHNQSAFRLIGAVLMDIEEEMHKKRVVFSNESKKPQA